MNIIVLLGITFVIGLFILMALKYVKHVYNEHGPGSAILSLIGWGIFLFFPVVFLGMEIWDRLKSFFGSIF